MDRDKDYCLNCGLDKRLCKCLDTTKTIEIPKDNLFKVVKEIRELRKLIKGDSPKEIMYKHDLKIQSQFIDKILMNKGIDFMFNKLSNDKENYKLIEEAKRQEEEAIEDIQDEERGK